MFDFSRQISKISHTSRNMSSTQNNQTSQKTAPKQEPGDGLRSVKTTSVFRLINFELYAKPNMIIMGIGAVCLTGVFGYIAYMRYKYESAGYYAAVQDEGKEVFLKKKSRWDI